MDRDISYQTMQTNSMRYMVKCVEEFEQIKSKTHPKYKHARQFFADKKICFQNFYKFYNRYITTGRDEAALLPTKRGPKPKYLTMPQNDGSIERKVIEYRNLGHNKFVIAEAIKKEKVGKACSASTIYRIFVKHGISRLNIVQKEEKRKIVRLKAGSLLHVDCHYLPRGLIKDSPMKRYYILGVIDDYSRISWSEVIESNKAMDATFAMMDALMALNQEYGIKGDEILSDNGSEFCGGRTTIDKHPFERLLKHFGIKHLRTKPYRPQTNGKIERYWRSFDDEVIEGVEFSSLDDLKEAVLGYNFYYNEHRPHQGINGKLPISMLDNSCIPARKLETK